MVFASRVASYPQVARRCFPDRHKVIAHRRIRMLCESGLLRADSLHMDRRQEKYVETTERAWQFIQDHWCFEVDQPHFRSESPAHDMRFNEIIFRLGTLTTFRTLYPENLLQSSSALAEDESTRDLVKLQADGALLMNGPDGRTYAYGLEYELSKKSPGRYRSKLLSYYFAQGIDGVIYVSPEREILNSLARVDEEVRGARPSILYLGFESEVLKPGDSIEFRNAKEHAIELY